MVAAVLCNTFRQVNKRDPPTEGRNVRRVSPLPALSTWIAKDRGFKREGVVSDLLKDISFHAKTCRVVVPNTGINCVEKIRRFAVAQHVPLDDPTMTLHLTRGTSRIFVLACRSPAAFRALGDSLVDRADTERRWCSSIFDSLSMTCIFFLANLAPFS